MGRLMRSGFPVRPRKVALTLQVALSLFVVCGLVGAAAASADSTLEAPSGLNVSATQSSLTLTWDPVPSASGYRTVLDGSLVDTTASTSWTFADLSCGTSYDLGVSAYRGGAESRTASVSASTTQCPSPPPPPPPAAPSPPPPSLSAQTPAAAGEKVFGTTVPGSSTDTASWNLKEVSRYSAPEPASVSKLSGYVSGLGASSGSQPVRAVIYADDDGDPGALLGVSDEVTISAGRAWGWVEFPFPTAVAVAQGTVWMGYIAGAEGDLTQMRFDDSPNELHYNVNPGGYAAGPSDPFGSATLSEKHYSLYATYTPDATSPPPPPPPPPPGAKRFGTTAPGSSVDTASWNLKEVSRYSAPEPASVSKLSGYVSGLGASGGSQPVRAVIYADDGGEPGALLGVSKEVTISAGRAWGWADFTFPSAVSVDQGTVWMGYIAGADGDLTQMRYDDSPNELRYNWNAGGYAAGPTDPFGSTTLSEMHYSLYATYTPADSASPPPAPPPPPPPPPAAPVPPPPPPPPAAPPPPPPPPPPAAPPPPPPPPPPPAGATVYVAQSAAGKGDGSSCANAVAASFFNSASNWGSGEPIGPGKTVGLCGTITTSLTAQGSGASGSPITIYFTSGAKLSEPVCGPCLDISDRSYITVDGGANGIIEGTDNGTTRGHQSNSTGINAHPCDNCVMKNLRIQNIYVHSGSGNEIDQTQVRAIYASGSNILIDRNTVSNAGWALFLDPDNGDRNNRISNNDIYNVDHGITTSFGFAGGSVGPIFVNNNHFHDFQNWDTSNNAYHHDGIHCYTVAGGAGAHITDYYIYNNRFDGDIGGNATAWIFIEGGSGAGRTPCADSTSNIWAFNNFGTMSYDGYNGVFGMFSGITKFYNNTLVGHSTTDGTVCQVEAIPGTAFQNNICSTGNNLIGMSPTAFQAGSPDYNVYANGGSNAFVCGGNFYRFSEFLEWTSCIGGNSHSLAPATAGLSGGVPLVGSVVLNAGINLTGLCTGNLAPLCSDINGRPRPTSGPWDVGAFEN
jgi:hypothetical protein